MFFQRKLIPYIDLRRNDEGSKVDYFRIVTRRSMYTLKKKL